MTIPVRRYSTILVAFPEFSKRSTTCDRAFSSGFTERWLGLGLKCFFAANRCSGFLHSSSVSLMHRMLGWPHAVLRRIGFYILTALASIRLSLEKQNNIDLARQQNITNQTEIQYNVSGSPGPWWQSYNAINFLP